MAPLVAEERRRGPGWARLLERSLAVEPGRAAPDPEGALRRPTVVALTPRRD